MTTASRRWPCTSYAGSHSTGPPCARRALYIAVSARRSSVAASLPCSGACTQPTDSRTWVPTAPSWAPPSTWARSPRPNSAMSPPASPGRDGDGEPAATDPADQGPRHGGVQPAGHLAQQVVADLVAEGVVDLAEGVHGDGGEHDLAVLGQQGVQALRHPVQVGQPGHRVRGRRAAQVAQQPAAVDRGGQLGGDGLQQPHVPHVEAAVVGDPLGRAVSSPTSAPATSRGVAIRSARRSGPRAGHRLRRCCLPRAGRRAAPCRHRPSAPVGRAPPAPGAGVQQLADLLEDLQRGRLLDVERARAP